MKSWNVCASRLPLGRAIVIIEIRSGRKRVKGGDMDLLVDGVDDEP